MNRDEILAKSREENKNKDIYEQEILKQANGYAFLTLICLGIIFMAVQIFAGGGINYGIYAMVFSGNMTVSWIKFAKLKQKRELIYAVLYTLIVLGCSAGHIYNLFMTSEIL